MASLEKIGQISLMKICGLIGLHIKLDDFIALLPYGMSSSCGIRTQGILGIEDVEVRF